MSRPPADDGYPDTSCPECGGPTKNMERGARCDADDACGWWEQW